MSEDVTSIRTELKEAAQDIHHFIRERLSKVEGNWDAPGAVLASVQMAIFHPRDNPVDPFNADFFVQVPTPFVGDRLEPSGNWQIEEREEGEECRLSKYIRPDPSVFEPSEGGDNHE